MTADSNPSRSAWGPAPQRSATNGASASEQKSDVDGSARSFGDGAAAFDGAESVGDGRASREEPAASPEIGAVLLRFVEETFGAVDTLITVQLDRAKLSMRRTIVSATLAIGTTIVVLVGACAAVLALVRGICGGLTAAAGGRAWVGELAGGVLALALAAGVVALALRISNRRELARLEAKYGRDPKPDEHDPLTAGDAHDHASGGEHARSEAATSGDGRGVPRPTGSAGDRKRDDVRSAPG